jgi:hypothetical protein
MQIRAVRGPYTREQVGAGCPDVYGDPALLLPRFHVPRFPKMHRVGIVPHYVDYHLVKSIVKDCPVINVLNENPIEVADQICECEYIISSSLHGLIVANAYGIPAGWAEFSDDVNGAGFKFHDYYAAIGVSPYTYFDFREECPHELEGYYKYIGDCDLGGINLDNLWEVSPWRQQS